MERRVYFYCALILGLPVLRSLEVFLWQIIDEKPVVFYWLPQIFFSLFIGALLICGAACFDKNLAKSLWLLPLLAFVYVEFIDVLHHLMTRTFMRGGVAGAAIFMVFDGLLWALVAFVSTFTALTMAGKPKSL